MKKDSSEFITDSPFIKEWSKAALKTLTSSNSDEHNTPSYLIDAAREVLGVIDLDPMRVSLEDLKNLGVI